MNLLMLILIFLGLVVGASICYIAWELSSDEPYRGRRERKEPGDAKES